MGSYMALLIWILLIILPMQCNGRPGPFMGRRHTQPDEEEEVMHVADPHEPTSLPGTEILPTGGAGNASVLFAGLTSHSAFRYMFNFFPKGVPIPPSGPSPGHNSKTDGTDPASSSSDP